MGRNVSARFSNLHALAFCFCRQPFMNSLRLQMMMDRRLKFISTLSRTTAQELLRLTY
jgi:hypothetical protein